MSTISALQWSLGLTSFCTAPCCNRSNWAFGIDILAIRGYSPPTMMALTKLSFEAFTDKALTSLDVPTNPIDERAEMKSPRRVVMSRKVV